MCIAEIKSIKPGDLSRHILGMENKTPLIGRDINGNLRDANGDVVGGDWNPMRRDKGIECDRTISPKKGGK